MADQIVPITAGSGTNIDVSELTVGTNTVERQRIVLADPTGATGLAGVTAKGTQGGFALAVQELHDSGRNVSTLYMALPVLTTSSDVLMSLTGYKSGAAVAATTTPAVVTTGKTYRITAITITYVATTTAGLARLTLRANTSGVAAVGSPAVMSWMTGAPAATAGISSSIDVDLPDGLEFAAGTGVGVTLAGVSSTGALGVAGYGQISIYGYEY